MNDIENNIYQELTHGYEKNGINWHDASGPSRSTEELDTGG